MILRLIADSLNGKRGVIRIICDDDECMAVSEYEKKDLQEISNQKSLLVAYCTHCLGCGKQVFISAKPMSSDMWWRQIKGEK